MSCEIFRDILLTLPVEEFGELQAHLSHCPECRALANQLRHDEDALEQALVAEIPALSFDAVWEEAAIEAARPPARDSRRWVALAAAALLAVGGWALLPERVVVAEVAGVEFDEKIHDLEVQQESLEARWSELEAARSKLEAEQSVARAQARAAAETAETERLALESGGHEHDWNRWLAAERRAKVEADRARDADWALAAIPD